MTENI
jgi:radical S-adenosyl methionine domain-containing protein 2